MTPSVSLAQRHRLPSGGTALPLLATDGARLVLGARAGPTTAPIRPAADTLFGPRAACLAGPQGPLLVSDSGHHRLLVWSSLPTGDGEPADFTLGQADFNGEGRNRGGIVGPAGLNLPAGIAVGDGILALADSWNHRVLLWHGLPRRADTLPDIVLGQADFISGLANRGLAHPRADTLNWCAGVAIQDGRLLVADTGNRRVLIWEKIPTTPGQPADLVLGQRDFAVRDDGGGRAAGAGGMRWPHAVTIMDGRLFVADAGLSRVMAWNRLPDTQGASCDFVLGQGDVDGLDHNRGADEPDATRLNMPYGLAAQGGRLVVADTANSRLLGFTQLHMGAAADRLAGQSSFQSKGENGWEGPTRHRLCWPYGLAASADTLVVADSGNNRILLWQAA